MSTVCDPRPAVKRRAPRAKPERLARLIGKPTVNDSALLTLCVGGKQTDYLVRVMPSDFGEAFRLSKLVDEGDGPAAGGEVYDVLFENEFDHRCECREFLRHGYCKHIDSLKALRERGKI
jgi:hypothetical protein